MLSNSGGAVIAIVGSVKVWSTVLQGSVSSCYSKLRLRFPHLHAAHKGQCDYDFWCHDRFSHVVFFSVSVVSYRVSKCVVRLMNRCEGRSWLVVLCVKLSYNLLL